MKPSGPGVGFVSGNGRIEATEIDIATKLAGRVQEIHVNEGDFVKLGQPLAQMQIDVLDAQRDEAQAQSQQAVTAVASAEAQVAARQSDTAAAAGRGRQRESELDAARRRSDAPRPLSTKRHGDEPGHSTMIVQAVHGTEAAAPRRKLRWLRRAAATRLHRRRSPGRTPA